MQIEDGVELIEKGKSIKGNDVNFVGKWKLDDYRKLHDSHYQQGTDTMKKRMQNEDHRTEDPYRSFRRGLINSKGASPRNNNNNLGIERFERQHTTHETTKNSHRKLMEGLDQISFEGSDPSNLP